MGRHKKKTIKTRIWRMHVFLEMMDDVEEFVRDKDVVEINQFAEESIPALGTLYTTIVYYREGKNK